METHTGWIGTDQGLTQEYVFDDFAKAFAFLQKVAGKAEALNHHPEIWNSYNKVRLTLFTHDAGTITEKDHELARHIDTLSSSEGEN